TTSSADNCSPSWNKTSSLISKVYVKPSSEISQSVASSPSTSISLSKVINPSNTKPFISSLAESPAYIGLSFTGSPVVPIVTVPPSSDCSCSKLPVSNSSSVLHAKKNNKMKRLKPINRLFLIFMCYLHPL